MSFILIVISVLLFVYVLSQLGAKIPASAAVLWLGASGLLVFAAAFPGQLLPLANALGIQLVSNLFLSGFVVFLFLVALAQTVALAQYQRRLRRFITSFTSTMARIDKASVDEVSALIVIPCYNEEGSIADTVSKLQKLKEASRSSRFYLDYLVVNDGSIDATVNILERVAPNNFVTHFANTGVAGTILTGFNVASAKGFQYVVQCDADGQHPIEMIPELLNDAVSLKSDLLIGSRFLPRTVKVERKETLKSTTYSRYMGVQWIRSALRLYGPSARVYDPTSGFRVYSTKARNYLVPRMPDEYPEPESIALLACGDFRVLESPVEMMPRLTGSSSLSGLASLRFMVKVIASLLGLRIRLVLLAMNLR